MSQKGTKLGHLNLGNLFGIIVVVIVLPAGTRVRAQAGALPLLPSSLLWVSDVLFIFVPCVLLNVQVFIKLLVFSAQLSLTHTHTLSLSLSLSHTHTHTHPQCVSVCVRTTHTHAYIMFALSRPELWFHSSSVTLFPCLWPFFIGCNKIIKL